MKYVLGVLVTLTLVSLPALLQAGDCPEQKYVYAGISDPYQVEPPIHCDSGPCWELRKPYVPM